MSIRSLMLAALVAASAAGATAPQSRPAKASKAFKLDSIAPTAEPTPEPSATPDAAPAASDPAPATPAAAPAAVSGLRASFTLDTPIADLIADPAAKAVLDKDLPGLSSDENLDKFAKLGLRQFQPLTGGQLTDAMLIKVARDLATLSGPMLAPIAPTAAGHSKRNRDESR